MSASSSYLGRPGLTRNAMPQKDGFCSGPRCPYHRKHVFTNPAPDLPSCIVCFTSQLAFLSPRFNCSSVLLSCRPGRFPNLAYLAPHTSLASLHEISPISIAFSHPLHCSPRLYTHNHFLNRLLAYLRLPHTYSYISKSLLPSAPSSLGSSYTSPIPPLPLSPLTFPPTSHFPPYVSPSYLSTLTLPSHLRYFLFQL